MVGHLWEMSTMEIPIISSLKIVTIYVMMFIYYLLKKLKSWNHVILKGIISNPYTNHEIMQFWRESCFSRIFRKKSISLLKEEVCTPLQLQLTRIHGILTGNRGINQLCEDVCLKFVVSAVSKKLSSTFPVYIS
jgi:hypothetical protein